MIKKNKAFTLAEAMFALLIMAIILSIALPVITKKSRAKTTGAEHGQWMCTLNQSGQHIVKMVTDGIDTNNWQLSGDGGKTCTFTPPPNAENFTIKAIGGGGSGAGGTPPTADVETYTSRGDETLDAYDFNFTVGDTGFPPGNYLFTLLGGGGAGGAMGCGNDTSSYPDNYRYNGVAYNWQTSAPWQYKLHNWGINQIPHSGVSYKTAVANTDGIATTAPNEHPISKLSNGKCLAQGKDSDDPTGDGRKIYCEYQYYAWAGVYWNDNAEQFRHGPERMPDFAKLSTCNASNASQSINSPDHRGDACWKRPAQGGGAGEKVVPPMLSLKTGDRVSFKVGSPGQPDNIGKAYINRNATTIPFETDGTPYNSIAASMLDTGRQILTKYYSNGPAAKNLERTVTEITAPQFIGTPGGPGGHGNPTCMVVDRDGKTTEYCAMGGEGGYNTYVRYYSHGNLGTSQITTPIRYSTNSGYICNNPGSSTTYTNPYAIAGAPCPRYTSTTTANCFTMACPVVGCKGVSVDDVKPGGTWYEACRNSNKTTYTYNGSTTTVYNAYVTGPHTVSPTINPDAQTVTGSVAPMRRTPGQNVTGGQIFTTTERIQGDPSGGFACVHTVGRRGGNTSIEADKPGENLNSSGNAIWGTGGRGGSAMTGLALTGSWKNTTTDRVNSYTVVTPPLYNTEEARGDAVKYTVTNNVYGGEAGTRGGFEVIPNSYFGGGGGKAGSYQYAVYKKLPRLENIVVGAGGVITGINLNGNNGGNTIVGDLLIAKGGEGGKVWAKEADAGHLVAVGEDGQSSPMDTRFYKTFVTPLGGFYNYNGYLGSLVTARNANAAGYSVRTPAGYNCLQPGTNCKLPAGTPATAGNINELTYGAGGGGGGSTQSRQAGAGGAGAAGVVIIEW